MLPLKDNIPTARLPIITIAFIAINIIVFVWQFSLPDDRASTASLRDRGISEREQAIIEYGTIPREITSPGTHCIPRSQDGRESVCGSSEELPDTGLAKLPFWITIVTAMFMHGGILHIAGNMLFLWVFGNNIEDSMGRARFIGFYLLGGVAAAYTQAAISPESTVPMIGASGAVAGVLGGYALQYPHARVLTVIFIVFFFTLVEIPALLLLSIWFALQFLPAVGQVATDIGGEGGVAYFAHVGGFLFGLAAIKLFATRRSEPEPPYPVY